MNHPKITNIKERMAAGQALRKKLGRTNHSGFKRADASTDVLSSVKRANVGRVPGLIPLKMGRMALSPFSFFRGSAPLMAKDLSSLAVSGLKVQICGDAHVHNLGAYAAPDGHLVFDLNDFDETIPGPWEWDAKRLASSIVLAGREAGCSNAVCAQAVQSMVRCYRESMHDFCQMSVLELARFEIRRVDATPAVKDILHKAERVTPARVLSKLTVNVKGLPRFHDMPPILRHVPALVAAQVLKALSDYRATLGANRQLIFDSYTPVDVAFKVVGTGSVGTRDYVVLLLGNGIGDPLFIQVKEAIASCYEPYLPKAHVIQNHGQRVAQGQQRMQSVSDPFLGWTTMQNRYYLVRQLADHKASLDPQDLKRGVLLDYSRVCGEVLAKSHARTGNAGMLAGYCGNSDKLDKAISLFAQAYADQTERDYATFMKAIRSGKIKAEKVTF